jgi:ribosome recycling factor
MAYHRAHGVRTNIARIFNTYGPRMALDDGRVVRVPVPALTEERRRDLAKQVGERLEQCNVQLRNIRHDALDVISKAQKAKEVGEDEAKRLEKQVDDAMAVVRSEAEAAAKAKEQEIMTL